MKIATFIAGYVFVLFTLIPLFRSDNWIFRIFEYPRFQKLVISLMILILFLCQFDAGSKHDLAFIGLMSLNLIYLGYLIFPYTRIAKNQMQRSGQSNQGNSLSMLICNVFQDNRKVKALLGEIERYNPDLILLVEVDDVWSESLEVLHDRYPHRILKPLENTYGMNLYSKLDLVDADVKFLVKKNIPSIHTLVKLRNGALVRVYGLHPEPPVPTENPRSTDRDAEILMVAKEVRDQKLPVIVAGDLNDVAWSYTTELFLKVSGLLDPRRGRGFFNTFHVKYPMFRWPLDHVFCSQHFQLTDLKRLRNVGSDHFPIFISLSLSKQDGKKQASNKIQATQNDKQVAEEKIAKAR